MKENPLHLAIIIGSTRPGRFGPTVAKWFAGEAARRDDMTIDLIDLAWVSPTEPISPRLQAADAFVVVTPEYNHSFPAPLKSAIDAHSKEWYAKPIGFVSYGGVSGGLRAVEQLRQVFAELHAMTVRSSVSFPMAWELFDAGELIQPDRYARVAKSMLDQLAWWARALRDAKEQRPYAA